MKKIVFLLLIISTGCTSLKQKNAQVNDFISVEDLRQDVDYIHKKLTKLHPELYLYISQKELDFKFDSLKNSIKKPQKSFEFYSNLAPVLSSIRQGHISSKPNTIQLSKKETKILKKKGKEPLSQFEFEIFDDKMFVSENKSTQKNILIGSEILSINGEKISDLLRFSKKLFSSDGYNETHFKHYLQYKLISNFTYKYGIQDSIHYELKQHDSLLHYWIAGKPNDSIENKLSKNKLTKKEKDSIKQDNQFKYVHGYNKETKKFDRSLTFNEPDSCIATMKIKSFMTGDYKEFYKQSFKTLHSKKTEFLILDLRNNGGGKVSDITKLYSYLTKDSTYTMIDKQYMTQRKSILHLPYFKGGNLLTKFFRGISAPIVYPILLFKTKKDDKEKYYYSTKYSKIQKKDEMAYQGKIYVLINGGSFSATSIISSNLKGTKRAIFVGEETGGEYNGTVAGFMPNFTLPHSKVIVRFGLQFIAPTQKTAIYGRGIFPDVEILPTLKDKLEEKDPSMDWVLKDIENRKATQ